MTRSVWETAIATKLGEGLASDVNLNESSGPVNLILRQQPRILIADSSVLSQTILKDALQEISCLTAMAKDAATVNSLLADFRFDLILLASWLPDDEALNTLRTLRESEEFSHLPILVTLDGGRAEECLHLIEVGATDYLFKPLVLNEVLTRVVLALQNQAVEAERELLRSSVDIEMATPCSASEETVSEETAPEKIAAEEQNQLQPVVPQRKPEATEVLEIACVTTEQEVAEKEVAEKEVAEKEVAEKKEVQQEVADKAHEETELKQEPASYSLETMEVHDGESEQSPELRDADAQQGAARSRVQSVDGVASENANAVEQPPTTAEVGQEDTAVLEELQAARHRKLLEEVVSEVESVVLKRSRRMVSDEMALPLRQMIRFTTQVQGEVPTVRDVTQVLRAFLDSTRRLLNADESLSEIPTSARVDLIRRFEAGLVDPILKPHFLSQLQSSKSASSGEDEATLQPSGETT